MFLYDISDSDSFNQIADTIEKFDRYHVPKLLIGTKMDLGEDRAVDVGDGSELAEHFKMLFVECSAKSGANVNEAFEIILREMRRR